MKQFKTVFNFEIKGMLKSKAMIIGTALICAVLIILTTIPSVTNVFESDESNTATGSDNTEIVEPVAEEYNLVYLNKDLEEKLSPVLGKQTHKSQELLEKDIEAEKIDSGYVIEDYNSYTFVAFDSSLDSFEQMMFEEQLSFANEQRLFAQEGIDANKVYEIMSQPIESNNIVLGKDASSGFVIAFAIIFVMYILILLFGNNVATSVAREKDSRTMELLITSTKPKILILGKVAAAGIMGVLQISAIVLSGVIGFLINKGNYPDFLLDMIQGSMTLDTLFVYILFSVLGYILYLFIFASLGSLVSKVEDVQSAVAPITFLFVFAYLAATLAMQMPDNPIIKITSFIPFVSLFTMPIRYMLTTVPLISILSSSVIMIVTVLVFAALSIYIYRFGSLNYGNKISFKEIIKSFRR